MNNSSFSSSSGTSGVRITRRSARNWITLVSKESLTPKLSSTSKGFIFFLNNYNSYFYSLDVPGFADKYLSVSGEEDEAAVKKLTSKREKGFLFHIIIRLKKHYLVVVYIFH